MPAMNMTAAAMRMRMVEIYSTDETASEIRSLPILV